MFPGGRVAFSLQGPFGQSRRYAGDEHAPAPVTVQEILKAATIDGARCAGLDDRIGSLTPGKQADLIMIRTDDISLFPSNNAVGTVVHAAERRQVDTVMVAGCFRKQGGKLLDVDFVKVRRATEDSLSHIFQAASYDPDCLEERFPALAGKQPPAWTGN